MNRRTMADHVRRYPWWYGVAAIWLAAVVALPIVELDPLETFSRDDGPAADAPAGAGEERSAFPSPGGSVTTDDPDGIEGPADAEGGGEGEDSSSTSAPSGLELVPPEVLDLIFDALPPVVFPPLPDELATLARAMAPIASYGCSGLGLASIIVAVVAQTAEGVPLERVLPYLAPVIQVCANFPIAPQHTVCAADVPFVVDLGGLTKSPPILGLGIDQLEAFETILADSFGQNIPRLAPELRTRFDCTLVG